MQSYYIHTCACGCGKRIPIRSHHKYHGVPQYIHGHNKTSSHPLNCHCGICDAKRGINHGFQKGQTPWCAGKTKEEYPQLRGNTSPRPVFVDRWALQQESPVCACGCGNKIPIQYHHRWCGIPKYIHGHNPHSVSKEGRDQISEANKENMKRHWQDPSYVAKQMAARQVSQNKAELLLQQILDEHFPNQWKFVGDGQLIVAGKCPDFVHTSRPLLIELFGDYWHSEEVTGVPKEQHEKERIQLFESKGYRCLVVWECALEDANLIKRIQNFEMES